MSSYCFKCRKNTGSEKQKAKKKHGNKKTKNGRITPLSNCAVCDSKKSKLMKEWEASRL